MRSLVAILAAVAVLGFAPLAKADPDDGSVQRTVSAVTGGLGIAMLGFGTFYAFDAKSTYDDASAPGNCPKGTTSCNSVGIRGGVEAHDQADAATVLLVAGTLLTVGGIYFFVTAPKNVAVGATGNGVKVVGTF